MHRFVSAAFLLPAALVATTVVILVWLLAPGSLWAGSAAPNGRHAHSDALASNHSTNSPAEDNAIVWQFSPNPAVITVTVGTTVTWNGIFGGTHPLQEVGGEASDTVLTGDSHFGFSGGGSAYTFRFESAGVYFYRCGNHGVAQFGGTMRGKIVVVDEIVAPPGQQLFLPFLQQ